MAKKKTHEEYVAEVAIKNSNVEVIGKYDGNRKKILHKCLNEKCNYEWYANPHDILSGTGCPKCAGNIKKTHEEFIEEMFYVNPYIKILGTYINASTKVKCRCLVDDCNHIWEVKPTHLLNGHGCPKCAHKMLGNILSLSHEDFEKRVKFNDKNIELLSDYVNATTKIKYKCLECEYVGYALPYNLIKDNCPRCSNHERYTTEDFRKKILLINPNVLVIGEYVNRTTKIECMCLLDGCKWNVEPRLLLNGSGCPQCYETNGERRIRLWLEKHNIPYNFQETFNDCKDKRLLPFDFYLPTYNTIIEYDGEGHFKSIDFSGDGKESADKQFILTQKHDNIKNEYCKNNDIKLLRIPYFKNIEEELNNFLFI